MIRLYHCSYKKIEKFNTKNGVHFGGLASALEAGLRKVDQDGVIYIHECLVNDDKYEIVDDAGCFENWENLRLEALRHNIFILKYKNKYEPDLKFSYLISDLSLIELVNIRTITAKEAEKLLN